MTSYGSRMAPTLEQLYRDLHRTEAELLAARTGRVGSRWWSFRVAEMQRLRSSIDGLVRIRAASRNWWSALP